MIKSEEFGDKNLLTSIYRGVVEDNKDPQSAGRCKVRVFGIHSPNKIKTASDGIPTNELPWAQPALSLIEGSISGYGFFGVPLQGSHVFLFFEGGNHLQPRYFATAPAIPCNIPDGSKGFNDPDGVYPETFGQFSALTQPDWNSGDRTMSPVYPHNIVLATHGGHLIEIDSTPGNKRYKIKHPSGTCIDIDNDGNVDVSEVGHELKTISLYKMLMVGADDDETITRNKSKIVGINENITVNGTKNETVVGNHTESTGAKSITVTGNYTINVTGNVSIGASGTVTITSSNVQLGMGTMEPILKAAAANKYNTHTHNGTVVAPPTAEQISGQNMAATVSAA